MIQMRGDLDYTYKYNFLLKYDITKIENGERNKYNS